MKAHCIGNTLWHKWYQSIEKLFENLPYDEMSEKIFEERRESILPIISKKMWGLNEMAIVNGTLMAVVYDACEGAVISGYSSEEELRMLEEARRKLIDVQFILEGLLVKEDERHKKEGRDDV